LFHRLFHLYRSALNILHKPYPSQVKDKNYPLLDELILFIGACPVKVFDYFQQGKLSDQWLGSRPMAG
jgi:hypothetical protein